MLAKEPLRGCYALICSIRATDGGGSIVAETPDAGPPSWRAAQRARPPAEMRRTRERFATLPGPWGFDDAILTLPAATAAVSRSPPRSSENTEGDLVTAGNQVACVHVVVSYPSFKLRAHGSQPLCNPAAASQRGAAMLPPRGVQAAIRDTGWSDEQPTVPPSVASRDRHSQQLFGRRTSRT